MEFLSSALQALKPSLDDDFVDRLNYYYTPSMVLIFGLIISAKQWVGQPIECWVPAQFTGAWEQYTEDYCFVQNTYWLPLREVIPISYYERERRQIGYYQWVPFILAFQALFFYMPYMVWRLLNWQTGIDIHGICSEAEKMTELPLEDQPRFLKSLTAYIRETLRTEKEIGNRCAMDFWQMIATHYGFYVVILQFLMKALFLCNSIAQIFFMNAILGNRDSTYGFWTFFNMIRGIQWEETGVFPRITMCDFEVRVLGNLHRCLYEDFKLRKMRRRWDKLSSTDTKASQTDIHIQRKMNKGNSDLSAGAAAEDKVVQTSAPASLTSLNPFRSQKLLKMLKLRHL